jgi:hypothetical protein
MATVVRIVKQIREIASATRATVLVAAMAAVAGCSWENPFVIVNESASDITVEYQFGIHPATANRHPPVRVFELPGLKNKDTVSDFDEPWHAVSQDRLSTDEGQGIVRVVLAPGDALRVRRVHNYSIGEYWEHDVLLESVSITTPLGGVRYTGDQLRSRFVADGQVYVLRFPGS